MRMILICCDSVSALYKQGLRDRYSFLGLACFAGSGCFLNYAMSLVICSLLWLFIGILIVTIMVQMHDAAAKIAAKKDMHGACVRNGLRVPALKSKICTWKFLNQARLGEVYVPMLADVVLAPCPQKPTEKVIRDALITLINTNQHNISADDVPRFAQLVTHLQKHTADKEFMLDVISTLTKGQHEFFGKSYQPPKR